MWEERARIYDTPGVPNNFPHDTYIEGSERDRRETFIHIYFHIIESYLYIYFVDFLIFYKRKIYILYVLYIF